MKYLVLVSWLCSITQLIACGGAADSTSSSETASRSTPKASEQSDAKPARPQVAKKPDVEVPSGPPPKRLVVKDISTGSGAVAKRGDKLALRYFGVEYETGEEFEDSWAVTFEYELGSGLVNEGWERGLDRMRVGGVRELIVPSMLAFKKGALIYAVNLIDIRQAGRAIGASTLR